MKIGILQLNPVINDCFLNGKKILDGYDKLCLEGAELVIAPELAVLGYPPRDLLQQSSVIDQQLSIVDIICSGIGDIGLILGVAQWNKYPGKPLFNSAIFIQNGKVIGSRIKELLPGYDVFDESRYFETGPNSPCIVAYKGKRIGIIVCEDAWSSAENSKGNNLYYADPVKDILNANPDILAIINASPYYLGKEDVRFNLVSDIAKKIGKPVVYVNQVGGNDELIFDGRSFMVSSDGVCIGELHSFKEEFSILDTDNSPIKWCSDCENMEQLYQALVLGVKDYFIKTGHKRAVIGLSGGIDSAVVTCLAVGALGAKNVTAIGMPSMISSEGSVIDSIELCKKLGVDFKIVPISKVYNSFGDILRSCIGWNEPKDFGNDVTEENIQARIRGVILMAYSNRTGALVLSTGNKSEMAVGYCTLYGDMVGGLSVISDVPKTFVYKLAKHINKRNADETIPRQIIDKIPSAELRPDQKDQDSLPPYDILDKILHLYIEKGVDSSHICEMGFDVGVVNKVVLMVEKNEYKRRIASPGLKITTKAFGSGRRMPIAVKSPDVEIDSLL